MSKYEQRDNSGSLFKNERKEKDTHADYRGECLIGGVPYYMDAWLKKAESGRNWMSFAFKPKQAQPSQAPAKTHAEMKRGSSAPPPRNADFDDDVPF